MFTFNAVAIFTFPRATLADVAAHNQVFTSDNLCAAVGLTHEAVEYIKNSIPKDTEFKLLDKDNNFGFYRANSFECPVDNEAHILGDCEGFIVSNTGDLFLLDGSFHEDENDDVEVNETTNPNTQGLCIAYLGNVLTNKSIFNKQACNDLYIYIPNHPIMETFKTVLTSAEKANA